MNLNARMAFVGIAVVLVALVVGVPVLGAVFAQGGPFGQLVGVTDGTCEYVPSGTFSSTIVRDAATAGDTYILDRRVTVSDGTALLSGDALLTGFTVDGITPLAGHSLVRAVESGDREYIVAISASAATQTPVAAINTNIGTACSSAATDIATGTAPGAAGVAGNVALTNDSQLSGNRYAGILSAMILLIPLAVVVFFAMRFVQARMER